jgi:uncharacterized protein YqhQ
MGMIMHIRETSTARLAFHEKCGLSKNFLLLTLFVAVIAIT